MKPTDLMVGDLVLLFGRTPARVDAIGDCLVYLYEPKYGDWKTTYEHIKPMPLTADVIEKNTDMKRVDSDSVTTYTLNDGIHAMNVCMKDGLFSALGVPIPYVNDLQHALRLCGIEKEITI